MRHRLMVALSLSLTLLALATGVASADREDAEDRARRIPDVSVAMVLPAAGGLTVGAFYLRDRLRRRDPAEAEQVKDGADE